MTHPRKIGNLFFAFAVFAFALIGSTASASAQSFTLRQGQSHTLSYTSSFGSAGAAVATFRLSGNTLVVNYKNTSTAQTYLNGIGFNAAPHIVAEDLATATATGGWRADAESGGGLGNFDLMAYSTGRTRLSPGASGTAVFILTSARPEIVIEQSIVHLTSLPNGNSEKPGGISQPPSGDPNNPCSDPFLCGGIFNE